MKILVLSDIESRSLWDFYEEGKLHGIELIISCGDLKPAYLTFLVTMANVPVLYVHGNHDGRYETVPPEGCICIEDDIYVHNGVRILGLGGSMLYNYGPHQFSERQMRLRVRKLWWKLKKHKGFDILVTHAPAYGFHDGEDLPHRGFLVFHRLLEKYRPRFFLHGHMHMNYYWCAKQWRECAYNEHTTVVNAYEQYVIEY